jgi:hypothetical protein
VRVDSVVPMPMDSGDLGKFARGRLSVVMGGDGVPACGREWR